MCWVISITIPLSYVLSAPCRTGHWLRPAVGSCHYLAFVKHQWPPIILFCKAILRACPEESLTTRRAGGLR
jgi:hypothetical protein